MRFVLHHQPELPAAPTIPVGSPVESMLGQAAWGIRGVTVRPDGSLSVDQATIDPAAVLGDPDLARTAVHHAPGLPACGRQPHRADQAATDRPGDPRPGAPAPPACLPISPFRWRRGGPRSAPQACSPLASGRRRRRRWSSSSMSQGWSPRWPGLSARPRGDDRPGVRGARRARAPCGHRTALLRAGRLAQRPASRAAGAVAAHRRRHREPRPVRWPRSSTAAGGSPGARCPPTGRSGTRRRRCGALVERVVRARAGGMRSGRPADARR